MSEKTSTPDWCPEGFVDFLELSLVAHRRNEMLIREGVEKQVFPAQMLEDQQNLVRRNEELLEAVRAGDREAFARISGEGRALSAALSDQAQALRRERAKRQDAGG